jgi:hypothetical protein
VSGASSKTRCLKEARMSDDNDAAQAARYTLVIQWSDEDQ